MPKTSFGFEKPEDSSGFLLWQTTVTWQRLIKKAIEPYDVSHPQFVILAVVLWFEEIAQEVTQSLIISETKLDKMTISNGLKKLSSKDLIQRYEHSVDTTRAKVVHLTNKGKALIKKLLPIVEAVDQKFFQTLEQKDQHKLNTYLNKLAH